MENYVMPETPILDALENGDKMENPSLEVIIQLCRERLSQRDMTIWEACEKDGLPKNTAHAYHKILTGETRNPYYPTVVSMAEVCGIRWSPYPFKKND